MSSGRGNINRKLVVIAHNIRSLHNIGSFFRTADAVGVAKIYLTGYSGAPTDPKAAKVSLGAEKTVPWERARNISKLLQSLHQSGFTIGALEQHARSISLNAYQPHFPLALIVGNEVRGISSALLKKADRILEIPMRGKMVRHAHHPKNLNPERRRGKESLNVSVAFGIAVYELLKVH